MSILEIKDMNKYYQNGEEKLHVLKNVNLKVEEGEFLVVLGASGSGKSTLLNMIGGIDAYDSGSMYVMGKEFKEQKDEAMSKYRRETLGFIFQSFHLLPILTVYENVIYPIQIDGKKVDRSYVESLLDELGILQKKDVYPNMLSGGQQQRVAIARALANKPQIILADEPTGNLDSETGEEVLKILLEGVRKHGQTLVMITHNEEIAKRADRVVYMKNGTLQEGSELSSPFCQSIYNKSGVKQC